MDNDGIGDNVDPDAGNELFRDIHEDKLKTLKHIGGDTFDPKVSQVLPRIVKSNTGCKALCGPPTVFKKAGSLGAEVAFKRENPGDIFTVYAHIDVLCGVNFPAMDENGLCDPVWTLEVGNASTSCYEVPPTLNPTYVNRCVLPFKFYMPSHDD